jgi:hypothetical protein
MPYSCSLVAITRNKVLHRLKQSQADTWSDVFIVRTTQVDIERSNADLLLVCKKQVASPISESILLAHIFKRLGSGLMISHLIWIVHQFANHKLESVTFVTVGFQVPIFGKALSSKCGPLTSCRVFSISIA